MPSLGNKLIALLSGALLTLSFAPFTFWPASFISLFGLAYLLFKTPQASILLSYLFGIGLFATGSSWVYISIHEFGNTGAALASLLVTLFTLGLALFFALFGLAFKYLHQGNKNSYLLFAALWVLSEWLRSVLLTGFPWLFVGYGHTATWFAALMPVFGVYGASFAVALISAFMAKTFIERTLTRHALIPLAIAFLCWPLSHIQWTKAAKPPLTIGVIQPNLSQHEKWDRNNLWKILHQLQQQTLAIETSDIVVWPEAAIPANYQALTNYVGKQIHRANSKGYTLIAGMPYKEITPEGKRYFNSQWVSNQNSNEPNFYFKQHLVPFGEYVPFEKQLRGLIAFFNLPSSHFSEGEADQPQLFAGNTPIAIYICYEVAYPDLVSKSARTSELLITTSNDGWFGHSIGPKQHFQIAATRALENAKPMVRATNNGVTGFIDHRGQTTATIAAFKRDELMASVQPMQGNTPFSRFGSWPIVALCLLILCSKISANWLQAKRNL